MSDNNVSSLYNINSRTPTVLQWEGIWVKRQGIMVKLQVYQIICVHGHHCIVVQCIVFLANGHAQYKLCYVVM